MQLFFVFFNKVRHTDISRPPTNGFVADVSVWCQWSWLHGGNLESQQPSFIYIFIHIFFLSSFDRRPFWEHLHSSVTALSGRRKERKKKSLSICLVSVDSFWHVFGLLVFRRYCFKDILFFFAVCTDDDISEILDLFDASIEGWSLSDFHRCIKRQRCILGMEFYLGSAIHPYIHLFKKKCWHLIQGEMRQRLYLWIQKFPKYPTALNFHFSWRMWTARVQQSKYLCRQPSAVCCLTNSSE